MNINATQSHLGEHLVAKRLYAILKYICLAMSMRESIVSVQVEKLDQSINQSMM